MIDANVHGYPYSIRRPDPPGGYNRRSLTKTADVLVIGDDHVVVAETPKSDRLPSDSARDLGRDGGVRAVSAPRRRGGRRMRSGGPRAQRVRLVLSLPMSQVPFRRLSDAAAARLPPQIPALLFDPAPPPLYHAPRNRTPRRSCAWCKPCRRRGRTPPPPSQN